MTPENDKITAAREQRDAALADMQKAADSIDELAGDASDEIVKAAEETLDTAEREFERAVANLHRAERVAAAREHEPIIVPADEADKERGKQRITLGKDNDLVYRQDRTHSFFRDLYYSGKGDLDARKRIDEHTVQARVIMADREQRNVTTSDPGAAGVVPPVYLADMLADLPREGRPTVDIFPTFPFPAAGTTLTVPRVTTGTTVAVGATEAPTVSETDIDFTTLSVGLVTIAGQNDVSIQALDRTFPGLDQIIFRDLASDYDEQLDTQILEGTGNNGQHLGIRAVTSINTVTYTDSNPTAAEHVGPIFNALAKIHNTRHKPPTHLIMTPLRAAFLAANLGTSFSLFKVGSFGSNEIGAQDAGLAYNFGGIPVVVDANISQIRGAGTNEDEVYAVRAPDLFVSEGPLVARAMGEVLSGTLEVRLQVYAYSYFVSGRYPSAITKLSGTGLTAPAFA